MSFASFLKRMAIFILHARILRSLGFLQSMDCSIRAALFTKPSRALGTASNLLVALFLGCGVHRFDTRISACLFHGTCFFSRMTKVDTCFTYFDALIAWNQNICSLFWGWGDAFLADVGVLSRTCRQIVFWLDITYIFGRIWAWIEPLHRYMVRLCLMGLSS